PVEPPHRPFRFIAHPLFLDAQRSTTAQTLCGETQRDVYSGTFGSQPHDPTRETKAVTLDLLVSYHDRQRHLPVIEFHKAT
ncbi:MAG: hypothetical protein WCP86_07255, partial [bacterium]